MSPFHGPSVGFFLAILCPRIRLTIHSSLPDSLPPSSRGSMGEESGVSLCSDIGSVRRVFIWGQSLGVWITLAISYPI